MEGFSFDSMFGNPWDFGTGFDARFGNNAPGPGVGLNQPIMPTTDLGGMDMAKSFAGKLAQSGIRPNQFMADPSVAAPVLQQPQTASAMQNAWDATPVSMPGGKPISVPGVAPSGSQSVALGGGDPNAAPGSAPTTSPTTEDTTPPASEASAAGTEEEKKKGGKTLADKFVEGLKGVKAPANPALQSIRSPAAPQLGAIKSGELLALLAAMGAGGAGPGGGGGLKLPPTLGMSLKGQY